MPSKKTSSNYMLTKKKHSPLPDTMLCEKCKLLGYCKKFPPADIQQSYEIATSVQVRRPFDLKYFIAKIPFRVDPSEAFSQYSKGHLQTAYDAFHQDDFETALLHFKAVEPAGAYYSQSNYFLALTYFMLENYEMAGIHMQACIDHTFYNSEDFSSFLDECSRLSVTGPSQKKIGIIPKELIYT